MQRLLPRRAMRYPVCECWTLCTALFLSPARFVHVKRTHALIQDFLGDETKCADSKNQTGTVLIMRQKSSPPTVHGADTAVFRLTCELNEPVKPEILQHALDRMVVQYPNLRTVLRRGVFWYYLEQTNRHAQVVPEHTPPCAQLYQDSRSSLFEVSYWKNKINFDVFHVVADGAGAIDMLQTLVTEYVSKAYHLDVQRRRRPHLMSAWRTAFKSTIRRRRAVPVQCKKCVPIGCRIVVRICRFLRDLRCTGGSASSAPA